MRRILATILCVFMALGPSHLMAQDTEVELTEQQQERVLKLISTGKAAYNEGRFADALESFRSAHEMYPHPDIVYRMALCHERLGEDQQAVRYYKEFLAAVPDAPERPRIEKTIELIESRISKSEIRVVTDPEGAVVYIDDVANGAAGYTPTELPVKPGNYRVIVKKDGFESVEELVEVGSGQSVALRYQLKSVVGGSKVSGPGTDGGVKDSAGSSFDPTWVILMSVGIASLTAAALFYQPYRAAADNLEAWEPNKQVVGEEVYGSEERKKNIYLGITIGTASLGGLLLVLSLFAYSSSTSGSASLPANDGVKWSFGPTNDGRGATAGLGWSW